MPGLLYEEQTRELRGIIFKVRNELKSGWSEEIYHQALVYYLRKHSIPTLSKPRKPFLHRGVEVHKFEPDIIVWDSIILELKALPYQKQFAGAHYAQLIHYLKFYQMSLGLLVNFGPSRVNIKRVLWDKSSFAIEENYKDIQPLIYDEDKALLQRIRQLIITLANLHGLGYPEAMYRKLVAIEAAHEGLECISEIGINANWNDRMLGRIQTQYLQFEKQYLIHIRSLLDNPPTYDFQSTKTYLNALGLKLALIVNFGKKTLQIFGVPPD